MMDPLFFRADANKQIGIGHVMRCMALAQAWQDAGGISHFVSAELPDALIRRFTTEGLVLHRMDVVGDIHMDAAKVTALARDRESAWVVVDGYQFDAVYQRTLKDSGLNLLVIDDYGHAEYYAADLVLNQNIYAHASLYPSRTAATRLLLGTRYALLRSEFLRWRGRQRAIPEIARKILVTMGGADPNNVTLKVIEALGQVQVPGLEIIVVAGACNPNLTALQRAVQRTPHIIQLEQNVTNMPALMDWAELAVSSAGVTCLELAYMGVPIVCLSLAENQLAVATGLENAGVAIDLGWHTLLEDNDTVDVVTSLLQSPNMRCSMIKLGREQVDGCGSNRVIRWMDRDVVALRCMRPSDGRLVWQWANDPVTRSHSFRTESIQWEQHLTWFEECLTDPCIRFYVAEDSSATPIGQIRFQIEDDAAVVSVSLAPEQRGKGHGTEIIRLGSEQIWSTTEVMHIHAYIKNDNEASVHAFTKAGFSDWGLVDIQGYSAHHFVQQRS